jgi:two-component system nitrate/nitrite response regulator NarL
MLVVAIKDDDVPASAGKAGLTEREQQILDLIAVGLSNKVIASELEISEGTVKVHVKHLLKKLRLHSRVEAAVWALNRQD